MPTRSFVLASLLALALPACAGQAQSADDDDASLADGKADGTGGGAYYLIRPDLRRCAAPACGGSFVKRANFGTTRCADGSSAAECYVASVDYSAAGLDDNDTAAVASKPIVVRGSIVADAYASGTFGKLAVSEVWTAVDGQVQTGAYATVGGTLWRVRDSGIRCITTPCPSWRDTKLNGTTSRNLIGVDLTEVDATADQVAAAQAAMSTSAGIIVDGNNVPDDGSQWVLFAENFYARVTHEAPAGDQPQPCGGTTGYSCPAPTQWCDPAPTNACGATNPDGVCKITYLFCSQVYVPVCGCDGTTYANDCERVRAKVQKAHDGACASAN